MESVHWPDLLEIFAYIASNEQVMYLEEIPDQAYASVHLLGTLAANYFQQTKSNSVDELLRSIYADALSEMSMRQYGEPLISRVRSVTRP